MKLLLLSLCLFGVVIANSDPSSPESIKNFSKSNLTRAIDSEIRSLEYNAKHNSVTYFVNLINDLKAKFVRHRANVLELWTNANLPAGSDILDRINYVAQYYKKDFELLEQEKRRLLRWTIPTEDLKHFGLRVAAQKILDKNNTSPVASDLVKQVRAIIDKKSAISKQVKDVSLAYRKMSAELADQCRELRKNLWIYEHRKIAILYPISFPAELWDVDEMFKKLRNSTDPQRVHQTEELEKAFNLTMAVEIEARAFIPINSPEKVDQFLEFELRHILQNRAFNKLFEAVKKTWRSN